MGLDAATMTLVPVDPVDPMEVVEDVDDVEDVEDTNWAVCGASSAPELHIN